MKIAISSGHSKYCRGAAGIIDEVDEARRVVDRVAELWQSQGMLAGKFHDDVSTTQDDNLARICDWHCSQQRDLDVSVHFNAYTPTDEPVGTECLYVTQEALAAKVASEIAHAGVLLDRGAKYRDELYFLNNTDKPAILIEVCFVDSTADVDCYTQRFEAICQAICKAVAGDESKPVVTGKEKRSPLQPGDQGSDVAYVQELLGLPNDGYYGPVTETWVYAFQSAAGLPEDGTVGVNTWASLSELEDRLYSSNVGLDSELSRQIQQLVTVSGIADLEWDDRGTVPFGYYLGMCEAFALACRRLANGDPAIEIMAQAAGDPATDALAYYAEAFAALEMSNTRSGATTLRHLFVLMIGLGVRESSGNFWEGRDLSADNVEADTTEAGLFQTSWNIRHCSNTIPPLLEEFWQNPNGFRPSFESETPDPSKSQLDCYGGGEGARYQWLARYCPCFTVFVTGVGLRLLRAHWGPIGRREVEIVDAIDDLLLEVQDLPAAATTPVVTVDITANVKADGKVKLIVNGEVVDLATKEG